MVANIKLPPPPPLDSMGFQSYKWQQWFTLIPQTQLPGCGTLSSVSMPNIFNVSISSGVATVTLASQPANTVLAAPDGSAGTPTFRNLSPNDFGGISADIYAFAAAHG